MLSQVPGSGYKGPLGGQELSVGVRWSAWLPSASLAMGFYLRERSPSLTGAHPPSGRQKAEFNTPCLDKKGIHLQERVYLPCIVILPLVLKFVPIKYTLFISSYFCVSIEYLTGKVTELDLMILNIWKKINDIAFNNFLKYLLITFKGICLCSLLFKTLCPLHISILYNSLLGYPRVFNTLGDFIFDQNRALNKA